MLLFFPISSSVGRGAESWARSWDAVVTVSAEEVGAVLQDEVEVDWMILWLWLPDERDCSELEQGTSDDGSLMVAEVLSSSMVDGGGVASTGGGGGEGVACDCLVEGLEEGV